jgi:hypothetical protein
LEPFCDGDMIFEPSSIDVDCMHEFHQHCIYQWCMLQTTCPCCRRELLFINNRPTTNEGVVVSQSIPINSSSTSPWIKNELYWMNEICIILSTG